MLHILKSCPRKYLGPLLLAPKGKLTWQRKTNDLKIYFLPETGDVSCLPYWFSRRLLPQKSSKAREHGRKKVVWTKLPHGRYEVEESLFFDVATWKMARPGPFFIQKNRLEWSFEGLLKENDGSMNTLNCFGLTFIIILDPLRKQTAKQRLCSFLDLIYRLKVQLFSTRNNTGFASQTIQGSHIKDV